MVKGMELETRQKMTEKEKQRDLDKPGERDGGKGNEA